MKNAFLHGLIFEELYLQQPLGMADPQHPNHVCKLNKAFYGLKQVPRAWFDRFSAFILKYGFFFVVSLILPYLFFTRILAHYFYSSMSMICYSQALLHPSFQILLRC